MLLPILVGIAALSRFAEVAPNFAAVSASALFAGFVFRSRLVAAAVPIAAMVLSDLFIGFYHPVVMAAVYGAMVLPVFLGRMCGVWPGAARIGALAATASGLFFLISNFGVWLTGVYGWTGAGLAACYAAAVPFFKYTLAGDLFFAAMLFGAHRVWVGLKKPMPCGVVSGAADAAL